jgi:hypothetical protein
MQSPRRLSRIAGLWYGALAVFDMFGILFVDARYYAAGDAEATMG